MPINTKIEGDPDSIRATATWIRSKLQSALHDCGSQVYRARNNAEGGWRGDASSGFQKKMTSGGRAIDDLHDDNGKLAKSFDDYADGMHTAQSGMRRAREIATKGGLTINDHVIQHPGPAPAAPNKLPKDGSATKEQKQEHHAAVHAGHDHHKKVQAYKAAKGEADRAHSIFRKAKQASEAVWKDLTGKKYLNASNFTNGVAGRLIQAQRKALKGRASHLREDAEKFNRRYLKSPGGSEDAKFNEKMRFDNVMKASELEGQAGKLARIGGKIPVIGLGISAAGVGADIAGGKPPGKSIASGAAGTAAAFGAEAGAAAGAEALGASGLVAATGPVGVGIVAGVGVGLAADYAWDHWVPSGAKKAINDGVKDVGHHIASGAKKTWHAVTSIF